jgi:hypothetical protein
MGQRRDIRHPVTQSGEAETRRMLVAPWSFCASRDLSNPIGAAFDRRVLLPQSSRQMGREFAARN